MSSKRWMLWAAFLAAAMPARGAEPLVPVAAAPYRAEGRKSIFEAGGLRAVIEEIRPAEEEDYFVFRADRRARLFSPDGLTSPFLLFSLTLTNGTPHPLVFQPGFATVETERAGGIKALEITDLHALLFSRERAGGGGLPPEERRALAEILVWSHPQTLAPGATESKLLVFPPPPPKAKRLFVDCAWLYVGEKNLQLAFPFEIPPPPKAKKKRR
jgi:hypothetical protein